MNTKSIGRTSLPCLAATVIAAGLLLGGGGAAGCAGQPDLIKAPGMIVDDPLPKGAYPQIVTLDGLERKLVGGGLAVDAANADASRTMRVRVTMRSIASHNVPIQYRFVFLGANGDSVTDDATWMSLTFAPRTERVLVGIAPNYQAADWKLEIRDYR